MQRNDLTHSLSRPGVCHVVSCRRKKAVSHEDICELAVLRKLGGGSGPLPLPAVDQRRRVIWSAVIVARGDGPVNAVHGVGEHWGREKRMGLRGLPKEASFKWLDTGSRVGRAVARAQDWNGLKSSGIHGWGCKLGCMYLSVPWNRKGPTGWVKSRRLETH